MEQLVESLAKFIAERVDGDIKQIKDEIEYELDQLIERRERENQHEADCVCCGDHWATDYMVYHEGDWFCEECWDGVEGEEQKEEEQEDPMEVFVEKENK